MLLILQLTPTEVTNDEAQDEAGSSLKARLVNMARKTLRLEDEPKDTSDTLDKLLGKILE